MLQQNSQHNFTKTLCISSTVQQQSIPSTTNPLHSTTIAETGVIISKQGWTEVSAVKFKCMNVGGKGSSVSKRQRIFDSVKKTCDITILTETKFKTDHWSVTKYKDKSKNGMGWECIWSPKARMLKMQISLLAKLWWCCTTLWWCCTTLWWCCTTPGGAVLHYGAAVLHLVVLYYTMVVLYFTMVVLYYTMVLLYYTSKAGASPLCCAIEWSYVDTVRYIVDTSQLDHCFF